MPGSTFIHAAKQNKKTVIATQIEKPYFLLTLKRDPLWSFYTVITCPSPPVVQAGSLVCSSGHQYQSACYLVCQSGYTAHAPFIVTCSADSNWTPPGTCLGNLIILCMEVGLQG